MHSNSIESYKKTLKLTKEQRMILVGTLLGDGHLETSNQGKTYRLKIEHSYKQKEYVDWLYRKLENWINEKPRQRTRETTLPNGEGIKSVKYGFTTYSHPAFRFYGQQFYPAGKKVVPKLISRLLNPLAIAIWYLDDGSYKSNRHRTFIIHTHGYSKSEIAKLQKAMGMWRIKSSIHRQNRENGVYWRIYVMSESATRFANMIEPIVKQLPSMEYKLRTIAPREPRFSPRLELGNRLPKK